MENRKPAPGRTAAGERVTRRAPAALVEPTAEGGAGWPPAAVELEIEPPPVTEARPSAATEPSESDKFYLDWARETVKTNIARLNELQRTLVVLNISLLGGSLLFYGEANTTPFFKFLVTGTLITAAIVAV